MRDMGTAPLTTPSDHQPCVLASRANDGIEVSMLWWPGDEHAVVAVVDTKTNHMFQVEAIGGSAMDVFHHPFAYLSDASPMSCCSG